MESKSIFQSKTAALAALTASLGMIPGAREFIQEHPDIALGIIGLAGVLMRMITEGKVHLFGNG